MIKECYICFKEFEVSDNISGRKKETCSKRCSKIYDNKYRNKYWKDNPDKADINRERAHERKMRISQEKKSYKDSIVPFEMNTEQLNIVCDECQEEFYANYKIYSTSDRTLKPNCSGNRTSDYIEMGTIISNFCNSLREYSTLNVSCTSWGAAVCPRCGLVAKHVYDSFIDYTNYNTATKEDYKEFYERLKHVDKYPIIKKLAIYLDNTRIDFLSEAINIRRQLCFIDKNKFELTEEEEGICMRAMLHQTKGMVRNT